MHAPVDRQGFDERDPESTGKARVAAAGNRRRSVGGADGHLLAVGLAVQLQAASAVAGRVADQLADDHRDMPEPVEVAETPATNRESTASLATLGASTPRGRSNRTVSSLIAWWVPAAGRSFPVRLKDNRGLGVRVSVHSQVAGHVQPPV